MRCDCFITESTFGLPIYRWRPQHELFDDIDAWWRGNAEAGRASLLMGYSFGKAQRILAGVDASIGPIVVHGAVEPLNRAYRAAGVAIPPTIADERAGRQGAAASARWSSRRRRCRAAAGRAGSATTATAFASGWMQLRGARRRRGVDRGFVLSRPCRLAGAAARHRATGAERVIVTHGYEAVMVRWLQQQGLDAGSFRTEYGDDAIDDDAAAGHADAAADAAAFRPGTACTRAMRASDAAVAGRPSRRPSATRPATPARLSAIRPTTRTTAA